MGTDKRERKKANRAAKIAEQEAAEAKARRIKLSATSCSSASAS
jgi:hypothetical protein